MFMHEKKVNVPKDVFMHLLSMIALYMSAAGLMTLLFQYVNLFFPDPLSPIYYSSMADGIRFAMASLVIVFPVYAWVMHMLDREYAEVPEARELRVRKWLVYFTLFLASVIIIGDLVTLVFNFLGGDLTVRFILKVLIVLAVVSAIFAYYLLDLRQKLPARQKKMFLWITAGVVAVSIVFGFFTAGSPFKARLYRFDEQRVNDLQGVQSQLVSYWIQKQVLPQDLTALNNDISGYQIPTDPETGAAYQYSTNGPLSFTLCAQFDLASDAAISFPQVVPMSMDRAMQNWNHESGRQCFTRTIDPQLYQGQLPPKPIL